MNKVKSINIKELDQKFDNNEEDVLQHFDLKSGKRPNREKQVVNVDLPKWMVQELDREAERLEINRQAVIRIRLEASLKKG